MLLIQSTNISAKVRPLDSYILTENIEVDYFVISSENVKEIEMLKRQRDYLLSKIDEDKNLKFVVGINSSAQVYLQVEKKI